MHTGEEFNLATLPAVLWHFITFCMRQLHLGYIMDERFKRPLSVSYRGLIIYWHGLPSCNDRHS